MNVVHASALIAEVRPNPKNQGQSYITIIDDDGSFVYKTSVYSTAELNLLRKKECKIVGRVSGRQYGLDQSLELLSFEVKPVDGSAAVKTG